MWRAWCAVHGGVGPPGERDVAEREAFRHEVWHFVEESTRASGVPFHVEDPVAIRGIAALLRAGMAR